MLTWLRRSLIAVALLVLFAFALLLSGSGNDIGPSFSPYARVLTIAAGISVGLLLALLIERALSLWSDLKRGAPGSGLRLRLLGFLLALALPPWILLFSFSLRLIDAAMDSWFQVDVSASLDHSLEMAREALAAETSIALRQSQLLAESAEIEVELERAIESPRALELTWFDGNGEVLATQSADANFLLPQLPSASTLARLADTGSYSELRRTPAPPHIESVLRLEDGSFLQTRYALQSDWSERAAAIEERAAEFRRISFLRQALKTTIWLVLGVVMLLGLLLTFFLAFTVARRLVAPVSELIVAAGRMGGGDLKARVAVRSSSELGALGSAFNRMGDDLFDAQTRLGLALQAVEAERTSLQAVQERMSSGLLTLSREGKVLGMNGAASELLGLPIDELTGKSLEQLAELAPQLMPLTAALREPIATGVAEFRIEVALKRDELSTPLLLRGARLPEPIGGTVVVFDDLGEVGRAQRETAWREVARRLAHEIKNPLTPIQLAAERLRRRYLEKLPSDDRDVMDRATNTIVAQVEALKTMVNAFSEYAQAPQLVLKPSAVTQLIHEVTQLYESGGGNVAFVLELQEDLPPVRADAGRLRQLMHNLIRNSEEARAPARVQVTIKARELLDRDQRMLEISVSDDGPGLPAELAERVFEPYVSSKPKGTGLGLAIVKRIVEEHGGNIRIDSATGEGARFKIRLPI